MERPSLALTSLIQYKGPIPLHLIIAMKLIYLLILAEPWKQINNQDGIYNQNNVLGIMIDISPIKYIPRGLFFRLFAVGFCFLAALYLFKLLFV